MSSDSGASQSSAHDEQEASTIVHHARPTEDEDDADTVEAPGSQGGAQDDEVEEVESVAGGANVLTFARTKATPNTEASQDAIPNVALQPRLKRPESVETTSTPDDTPSIQGSLLSSPGSSVPVSVGSHRPHRPTLLQPFERRFSSRLSPSPLTTPRGVSPAFLSQHSRQSSVSSNIFFQQQPDDTDAPQAPWEVVRWTKLKKITGQVFSEVGKRNFGRPTCLNVAASLVVGTSKGFILVFDYQQVLKSIIGPGTKAVECGPVMALAISADHSTVAGGHATGHIFTWELAKPAKPFLHIPPLDRATLDDRSQDGHISGVSILHLGFLGTRHTALVSADDGGMAFSHLATRGLGAIARSVRITRILGRYPLSAKSTEKPRKPSSVLAFSPLPLGNVEQPTDDMGLTALLTPYLLVIVSTTPLAQTQHKAPRPKEIAPHSTLSGCLAWFPAVKLKHSSGDPKNAVSKTKLVYCWSNILTILDVDCIVAPPTEKETPTELRFRPRSRWRAEEAVVAVQWLSRSVLGVLTISQRLVILEDTTLRMTDSFDLLQKHIYHRDLFSRQLRPVIEQLDETDNSLHGVVADAFYMSFRAYKGRLFLLGFDDISIGTLSNWADRLMAQMEEGDFIAAIGLATSYYVGDADKLTVGLPDDDNARHAMVQEKLFSMITASLKYTFSRQDDEDSETRETRLKELAGVCFTGLLSMKEFDFLFEDVYDSFEEGSAEQPFFETLEPYILDNEITSLPPNVLKDLITFYASMGRGARLEEMICRLSTDTMDINQVTMLCQQYVLYDALIHVWTRTIGDFITPLVNILDLLKLVDFDVDETENVYLSSAKKVFPYLAYTFTGRLYPSGIFMNDEQSYSAKKDIYRFLFSGKSLQWPPASGQVILTRTDKRPEPPFPYLCLVLEFDASSFMSMLNEAFEDPFLNGDQDLDGNQTNGAQHAMSFTPTRQYIINILFGIMTTENFEPEDIIYFYMFIARNLPKYPQHIMLPGTSLRQVLVGLCNYPNDAIKEDCQLSVEYLLSMHHPPDSQRLVPIFEKAGFHRVLKSVYRIEQQYAKLLETYLEDTEDEKEVFNCISDILRPSKGLIKKQVSEVKDVILHRALDLARIDAAETATTVKQYAPDLLAPMIGTLRRSSDLQYYFLRALIEPSQLQAQESPLINDNVPSEFIERYVQLMCIYNSTHVVDFVSGLKSGDLRLDPVLPALEQSGAIDAAVVLMARDGLVKEAMNRLVKHISTLETALTGLIDAAIETPDVANTEEAIEDLLENIQKYIKVGIWLCQGQTRSQKKDTETLADRRRTAYGDVRESDLTLDELLWLDLVDATVRLIRDTSSAVAEHDISPPTQDTAIDTTKILTALRTSVQQTFSALLASTTIPPMKKLTTHHVVLQPSQPSHPTRPSLPPSKPSAAPQTNPSFLLILRTFLHRQTVSSSPTLAHLRSVLAEIFTAYTFEETILSIANRFLDKEGFENVKEGRERRERGWRPRGQACEGCGRKCWGSGVGGAVWEAWVGKETERESKRLRRRAGMGDDGEASGEIKGKGKSAETEISGKDTDEDDVEWQKSSGALVLFACRHLWHRACLDKADPKTSVENGETQTQSQTRPSGEKLKCPLCR